VVSLPPRLLGHRGASASAPENTLVSFRKALAEGADGLEIDVRILRDGTPVVMHDDSVDRTTDGNGLLSEYDVESLGGLDAGAPFAEEFRGERVPLLDEVLDELLGKTLLALDLKDAMPETTYRALAERHRANRDAHVLVASFETEILAGARDHMPALPRALVLDVGQPVPSETVLAGLGLWGVFACHESVDERFVVDCRRNGLALFVYTVNESETAARLVKAGVEGILSDDPGVLRGVMPSAG
jgi:glycerophosphoryl diester phosphodiesterase